MKHILYIFLFIVIACKPTQHKNEGIDNSRQEYTGPKMMFYFFEAIKKENYSVEILLQEKKLADGKLKGFFHKEIPSNEFQDTNLLVTFLNDSTNTIQLQITNPLIEEIEFVNEEGNFEKKTIYHDKKEFVIRVPFDNPINNIKFEVLTKTNDKINPQFVCQINLE